MHTANRLPRQLRELMDEGIDGGIISPADASAIAFAYAHHRGDDMSVHVYAALIRQYIDIKLKDKQR